MLAPALQTVLQTLGLHMHDAGLGQRHALVLACVQLNVPHCRSQRAIPAARGVSKRARAAMQHDLASRVFATQNSMPARKHSLRMTAGGRLLLGVN